MVYEELIKAAAAYADRNDIEVNNSVGIFVLMAESRINRVLKTAGQTHRIYTQTIEGKEYYSLPSDYNGMRAIHFNTGPVDEDGSEPIQIHYRTPESMVDIQNSDTDKYYYTIVAKQLQIINKLPSGGTIEMVFYRKVPSLGPERSTNWLIEDSPDIYLSGVCAEIELFVKNYDAATLWDERMSRAIQELDNSDVKNRWAGNSLVMRNG
jgi:hypothetical protein